MVAVAESLALGFQQSANCRPELIGLLFFGQVDSLQRYPSLQLTRYFPGSFASGRVAVEHRDHSVEVVSKLGACLSDRDPPIKAHTL